MNAPHPNDPRSNDPRQLFERAAGRVDQGMAYRLRRAREAALQGQPAAGGRPGRLLPAGAFAAAVLALGLAWWVPHRPMPGEPLASNEIDALVQAEDAELYAWLAEGPVARSQP